MGWDRRRTRSVDNGGKTNMELILEIGPANGDLDYALDIVAAAKESGADWVKGQIYNRDQLVTVGARTYAQEGVAVPLTQYEDFGKQLSYDGWYRVAEECHRLGVGFFASVFDYNAIQFCEELGVERYKIASGDITYKQLIQTVAGTGKHVILSTGASTYNEIHRAVQWVTYFDSELTVLACSLSYPTRIDDANLLRMKTIRPIWPEVGYSDHTFGVGAIVRARQLGAVMVEKHFTITPGMGGDHDFAVTPEQLKNIDWTVGHHAYDGSPLLEPTHAEMKARVGARRSVWAVRDLVQGSLLEPYDVDVLRPGGGLEPWQLDDYWGRPLRVDVPAGQALYPRMF
jgi:N,N'-diacetyllegionaminate synthase